MQVEKRDAWGGKLEFILASLGLAVGGGKCMALPLPLSKKWWR